MATRYKSLHYTEVYELISSIPKAACLDSSITQPHHLCPDGIDVVSPKDGQGPFVDDEMEQYAEYDEDRMARPPAPSGTSSVKRSTPRRWFGS